MFKVIGLDELNRKLKSRLAKLKDPTKFYQSSIIFIDKWIQDNFSSEGKKAYPATGWKPLAPSTLRAREKGWGGYVASANPRILQDRGWLKSEWRHGWNRREGVIESGVPYGEYHDQGEPLQKGAITGKLPQRKILPTTKMIMPELIKIAEFWARKAIE